VENGKIPVESIESWISSQGYPLEMEVHQKFVNTNFITGLSNHYKDFETEKSREIDVTATLVSAYSKKYIFRVTLCIECKYSKDKPWVIFSGQKNNPVPYILSRFIQSEYTYHLIDFIEDGAAINTNEILREKYIGHSIVQALKGKGENPDDNAYTACMSAFKASIYIADVYSKKKINRVMQSVLAIPMVVLDGQLFDCHLNLENKSEVQEIEFGIVEWKYHNPLNASPYIYVVTKKYLEVFVGKLNQFVLDLTSIREEHVSALNQIAQDALDEAEQESMDNPLI